MKATKITQVSIINGLILLCLTAAEFSGLLKFHLALTYQWHKLLHILGVILFMGNMMVGPVWFLAAYYSKNKMLLKFANQLLQLTDLCLTIPGIALTVLNGLFLASAFGGTANVPWLSFSVSLLFIMWALSIPLIYLQEKMYRTIDQEPNNNTKINRTLVTWGIIGTIVMIPPTIIFYLMIFKSI